MSNVTMVGTPNASIRLNDGTVCVSDVNGYVSIPVSAISELTNAGFAYPVSTVQIQTVSSAQLATFQSEILTTTQVSAMILTTTQIAALTTFQVSALKTALGIS
jgi:hypothetical protein